MSEDEIRTVNAQMLENVRLSGMPSIGLTLYPVYPDGFFPWRNVKGLSVSEWRGLDLVWRSDDPAACR